MHYEASCGHIGGNLSCLDALITLHHAKMGPEDRFILSKGHAAGALYVTLWTLGLLTDADLDSFCRDGTMLPGHPAGGGLPGVLFSTGSLGHGPSLASGLALGNRMKKRDGDVYCLCSDGEWQEGSCWEALIFAVHHRLDRLTVLIDANGLQAFGPTKDVASMGDLATRIEAFGAAVRTIDGHDPGSILEALNERVGGKPKFVIMRTIKGRGLPFAGKIESHYLPLTREQYESSQGSTETP